MPRIPYVQLSPDTYTQVIALDKAISKHTLGHAIHDLVRIRVSQLNGCLFCTDMHVKEAKLHGERELRLYHVPVWQESALFDAREKAALAWAELVTKLGAHGVPESALKKILEHFSEKEVADLTHVIAMMGYWNRLGVAFQPEAGSLDAVLGLDKAGLA
jgi:AhpD family alkylhydroperoxidase